MLFVFDFESHLIKPGACAPRPVCMSYAFVDEISTSSLQPFSGGWRDVGKLSQSNTSLVPWQAGIEALAHALRSGAHIVAHHVLAQRVELRALAAHPQRRPSVELAQPERPGVAHVYRLTEKGRAYTADPLSDAGA